jgi:hypothetical protein
MGRGGKQCRSGVNDMATTHPHLAAELVGTDPSTVIAGTNKVLLWRCPNHPEPYPSRGNNRVRGIGCGYCSNDRLLTGFNDMATTHPHLAAELVGTDPTTVMAGTNAVLLWRCPNHAEPYPSQGTQRVKGVGCGYCSKKLVLPGFNDMATTHPHLAAELVDTDPTTVMAGTHAYLIWRCPNHPEPYRAQGKLRVTGTGCGYCAGNAVLPGFNDMATTHPHLAAELVDTDPTTVIAGTHVNLMWRCPNHPEPYKATGMARRAGRGCPICAGKVVLPGFNDLATTHAHLAAELIGTDPATITSGSDKTLLWRCPNHTEPYKTSAASRVRGRNCPYCSSGPEALPGFNDIATTHPHLAAELVDTDPTTVTAGTNKVLLWRCPNHPEPYPCRGNNRIRGIGCGYCANNSVLRGFNDMATTHPNLAAELVDIDPTSVMAGTSRKLTWRCRECGSEWRSTGASRSRGGHGCPSCAESGFDQTKPAILYLMERVGEQQIGITGKADRRFAVHGRYGWQLLDTSPTLTGREALRIESELKKWLKAEIGTLPGTSEGWSTARLEVPNLRALLDLAGVTYRWKEAPDTAGGRGR